MKGATMERSDLVELGSISELEDVLTDSSERAKLIFKHSITCPISARAYEVLLNYLTGSASSEVDYYLIVVQHARDVSNAAAERLNIEHQSPQAILIRDGRPVWNASHFNITSSAIDEAISAQGLGNKGRGLRIND